MRWTDRPWTWLAGRSTLASRAPRIALAYALFATAWIYLSDRALLAVTQDPGQVVELSVYKGVAFVAVTAVLLLLMMLRAFGAIEQGYEALRVQERTLRSEREFSTAMIESMPGVVYFYDERGRFLRWNSNFSRVSGFADEEIARMHPLDFFSGEDKARVQARIADVFSKGEAFVEADFVSRDGRAAPYLFTGRRIESDGSTWLVGVGIDISVRKAAETALREAYTMLEHRVEERTAELRDAMARAESADRLKSAFLATMSHELRTPLNSIIGFTGIVLKGLAGPLTEEQSRQLGMVRSSARHLLELINDVLDLSRIEAGQLEVRSERFDLRASVDKVAATMRPLAERKSLALSVSAPPGPIEIVSDRRRVEQILLNLLGNAVKFTERGSVALAVEPDAAAGACRLRVSDTGIGMKPEDLAQIFLPFRQIDTGLARQHEGTGLGLSICRRLAALLGGEISVASELGRGSEFTVTLPTTSRP